MEEVKMKEAVIPNNFKSMILAPSISCLSMNTESGNIDIINKPFGPKYVIFKTTGKPVEQATIMQPEFVADKLYTLSQDSQDGGYQSACSFSSYTESFLGDNSHSKKKSKELIGNINKQIGYLEEIMVHKDDKSLSYQFSKFPNEMKTNRQRQGP